MNKAPFAPGELVVNHQQFESVEGKRFFKVGKIYTVKDSWHQGPTERGTYALGPAATFFGVPDSTEYGYFGWSATRFRPLNPDDFQKIREKHGEPVKKAKERTE